MIAILFASAEAGPQPPLPELPDLSVYRSRTLALLRRYFRLSLDIGRLPSLLGREFFRARVASYRVQSFEDSVILVHDVEQCLKRLDELGRTLIARIALQEYTWEETALMMRCSRSTIGRRFSQSLDRLSEILLEAGLLRAFPLVPARRAQGSKTCQEGEIAENLASHCSASE